MGTQSSRDYLQTETKRKQIQLPACDDEALTQRAAAQKATLAPGPSTSREINLKKLPLSERAMNAESTPHHMPLKSNVKLFSKFVNMSKGQQRP